MFLNKEERETGAVRRQFKEVIKIYIPPFICGIIFTVAAEVAAILVYAIYLNWKNKPR